MDLQGYQNRRNHARVAGAGQGHLVAQSCSGCRDRCHGCGCGRAGRRRGERHAGQHGNWQPAPRSESQRLCIGDSPLARFTQLLVAARRRAARLETPARALEFLPRALSTGGYLRRCRQDALRRAVAHPDYTIDLATATVSNDLAWIELARAPAHAQPATLGLDEVVAVGSAWSSSASEPLRRASALRADRFG